MIRFGGVFNNTGYGIAGRDTAYAMIKKELPMTVVQFPSPDKKDSSSLHQATVDTYIDKKINYNINVAQIIPPMWKMLFEPDKYNIGYFFWETDKLCKEWVDILNDKLTNEIWVPCEWNKQACLNSGVNKPIYIVPQCTTLSNEEDNKIKLDFSPYNDAFKFYSIFQWTERKNGDGLIRAYLKEFDKKDNVLLVLKTHRFNTMEYERLALKKEITNIKNIINKQEFPPIYLINKNLSADILKQIHLSCDCYVTANRGEGWSMPIAEAMSVNKPVITTQIGGITELLTDESAYLIPHEFEHVNGMPWIQWYTPDQKWGKVKDRDIRKAMRAAFEDRKDYSKKTSKYKDILNSVNIDAVGAVIEQRLSQIVQENKF